MGGIKSDTEKILALIRQLMARADLSPQIKPRDELTQYSSAIAVPVCIKYNFRGSVESSFVHHQE